MKAYYGILIALLALAVYYDLRFRIIPNMLSLGGMLVGISLAYFTYGPIALEFSAYGILLTALIGYFAWYGGMIGGGDHKLLLTVASFLWYPFTLNALLYIAMSGGFLALGYGLHASTKRGATLRTVLKFAHIPYSIAIFVGTLVALMYN